MQLKHGNLSLSATDLANFLGCQHRMALDLEAAAGVRTAPHFDDPMLELLFKRGSDHEAAYVESLRAAGRQVVDLKHIFGREELVAATLDAMRAGTDIVVQGALLDGQWFGKPDLLMRVPAHSAFGDWSYEIADTKLSRETHAGAVLQLGLYSEMLGKAQGKVPEVFRVITPDPKTPVHTFRVNDYSAYFRLVRDQLANTVTHTSAEIGAAHYPEPVEHCHICPWSGPCDEKRHADDHLSLVAGITRTQRRELEGRDISTMTTLAGLSIPLSFRPDRGSTESYVRVREQARLQHESRGLTPPLYETRDVVEGEGLCRLPEPSPGDIFLDLEGDNLAIEGGREYLFGLVMTGADGAPQYHAWWGLSDAEEKASFEAVMDLIGETARTHPGMHVYHYAPYEVTNFKRLMGRYVTRANELDAMLREGRFVDLYAVVRQGLRAGIEGYSIKDLEPLYAFARDVELPDARRALRDFEYALATGALDAISHDVRETVEGYNRDDCVSTLRLRDWLEQVRSAAIDRGESIPRPTPKDPEPTKDVSERQARVDALREKLLAGVGESPVPGTDEHARWLLAYLLDFHRREGKASWWKYFALCDSTDEELMNESDAVSALAPLSRVDVVKNVKTGKPTGSVVDRYQYPPQEMEIRAGAGLKNRDGTSFGEVLASDRIARTLDVKKGKAQAELHPSAVFSFKYISTDGLEDAIVAVGDRAARGSLDSLGLAGELLLPRTPRLTSGTFDQGKATDVSAYATSLATKLKGSVLAIQGPPGAGKTYTGARMICALVAAGKKVGVLGPSHKVICNLLTEVASAAAKLGETVRVGQKTGDDGDSLPDAITSIGSNEDALRVLEEGELDVVGGTAWLWARADMVGAVDVLFVDEAGQVPLANAIAVSGCAASMVLLGDPQQLDQPQKGTHPDGVDASVLQHILGEHLTIPADRGIFLPVTWRLAPSICKFTSEVFYESRLTSKESLAPLALSGIKGLAGSGLWYVDAEHDGRTSSSDEEVEIVAALVEKLTSARSCWIDAEGTARKIGLADVLVVSPFNAQVSRLVERLPDGARAGTVDKFQGQEAPVVIYSMATSRPEDAPRGMEFLYSANRLNVATSRAKCAVIVVANARLFAPECRSPRQIKLANALCRYRELGRPLSLS